MTGGGAAERSLRAAARLAATVLQLLRGLAIVGLAWPRIGAAQREARIAAWSRGLLAAMGLRLVVEGRPN